MGIMDNEGHDPMGFGNVRSTRVMQADRDPHAALKDARAENGRLRAAISNLITTSHEEWDATIEYKEKKTLQSQERWTNALRATAEARAQARILLADEQTTGGKDG